MVFAYKDCSFSTGDRDGLKIRISPKIRSKITIKWKFERKYPQSQPVSLILKYIHFHTPGSKSLDKYFFYNPIDKEKNPTFFCGKYARSEVHSREMPSLQVFKKIRTHDHGFDLS